VPRLRVVGGEGGERLGNGDELPGRDPLRRRLFARLCERDDREVDRARVGSFGLRAGPAPAPARRAAWWP
jgi:hypothetical protein